VIDRQRSRSRRKRRWLPCLRGADRDESAGKWNVYRRDDGSGGVPDPDSNQIERNQLQRDVDRSRLSPCRRSS
jgi:hypothetical protein